MDIHILYHIIVYCIVFIPISLVLRGSFVLLLYLTILPISGEYIQIYYFPSFNFQFEYLDMLTNLIGSLIGVCMSYLISCSKWCLSFFKGGFWFFLFFGFFFGGCCYQDRSFFLLVTFSIGYLRYTWLTSQQLVTYIQRYHQYKSGL